MVDDSNAKRRAGAGAGAASSKQRWPRSVETAPAGGGRDARRGAGCATTIAAYKALSQRATRVQLAL